VGVHSHRFEVHVKKKKPDTLSLFSAPAEAAKPRFTREETLAWSQEGEPAPSVLAGAPLPDDDANKRPKLRLVHSQPEEEVTVTPVDDGRFEVCHVKAHGGTRLSIFYTRKQLEQFLARIPAALEMAK